MKTRSSSRSIQFSTQVSCNCAVDHERRRAVTALAPTFRAASAARCMATATAAAGSGISWEDEKAYFGFHPAALVDDVANVLLDYLCTGLDHVDVALTELEDEDNVMHADMVQRSIDDTTAQYQASVQRSFDALEREGLTVMRMPLQSVLPAAPPVASRVAGTFVAAEEEAIDAELRELRRRLAARTTERQRLEQQHRAEEKAGAFCAEALPALQRVVGPSANGEAAQRLVRDVSVLSDRVNALTRSVADDLGKAGM